MIIIYKSIGGSVIKPSRRLLHNTGYFAVILSIALVSDLKIVARISFVVIMLPHLDQNRTVALFRHLGDHITGISFFESFLYFSTSS